MTPLRRTVARRLVEAQQTAAILTTFNEVDMTRVLALRERHGEAFLARHGVKLGFMSFFVKAAVEALRAFPAVNGEIRGDAIVYKDHYDIGVAVGGGKGLVVPVVRDADALSFAEIEKTVGELAKKARGEPDHDGRPRRRDVHHLERRHLRLAPLDADPEPAAVRHPRPAQDREARRWWGRATRSWCAR